MEATCQLHNRTAFSSVKETRYGFHMRLGGHHSRSGRSVQSPSFAANVIPKPTSSSRQPGHCTDRAIPVTHRILDRRVESWAEFLSAWLWKPHNGKEQLYLNILSRAINHNSNCGRVLLSRNIHSGSACHFLRLFKFLRAVIQHIYI